MRPLNVALTFAASLILGVTGCDKIPTWGELTGGTPPAAPATVPVATRVETPVAVQSVKPAEPSAEEVIAKFKAMKSHEISDAAIAQLTSLNEGLDQITEINADGSKLTSSAFTSIEKLTNLKQLRLNSTRVDDSACNKIAMLSSLEVLALSDTTVGDVGVAALSALPNLKRLEMVRCHLNENGFNAIGQLPALEYIGLESTNLTNPKLDLICNAKTLKELRISRNLIDDYGLVALKKLTAPEKLDFNYSRVTGEGLNLAFKGGASKSLISLDLYACPLNEPGARAVATLKTIERLNLGAILALNDEALYLIITGMKKLKYLNLNQCANLTGQGLSGLKGNKEIEELQLTQCSGIGDAVIPFLRTLKSLKVVNCGGSAITPNAISALRAALPDAKIN